MNLFYDPTRFILEMQKAERLKINNESEYDISENIYSFPDDTFLYYIQNEYKDKYKEYFDDYLPNSKNDLTEDAKHYFSLYNPIFATCGLKDATMLYLLIALKENTHYLNAGVIPNSINNNNFGTLGKFVGLGIDNGMTDTFLLHIKRSTLIEFLENYMVDDFRTIQASMYDLPLFQGKTDYTNGFYSIPILAPITDEQSKLINSALHSNSHYNSKAATHVVSYRTHLDFVQHLSNVMNYKSRKSLKKFINLKNGQITTYSQQQSSER